jgi:hypothetical protein
MVNKILHERFKSNRNSLKQEVNLTAVEGLTVPAPPMVVIVLLRRVWRYQRGNQNPYTEEGQTTMTKRTKTNILVFSDIMWSVKIEKRTIF